MRLCPRWGFSSPQVSADDLAACAQHVVSRGYTRPARMAAAAHSAGGAILISAVSSLPASAPGTSDPLGTRTATIRSLCRPVVNSTGMARVRRLQHGLRSSGRCCYAPR
jgi:hypothetical protein